MSRIGKAPVTVPEGVEITLGTGTITTKGKKGELTREFDAKAVTVKKEENKLVIERLSDAKDHRAKHGLYRSIINNMVIGVSEGYSTKQELHGVGYRAKVNGQQLELTLGFSHPIVYELPVEVKVSAETAKGSPPLVVLESVDKQLIGQCAAKIRSFRKPEPYKGKGVRFQGEEIRRKAGKAAGK
jgi:large subunit ribosomal protein L6